MVEHTGCERSAGERIDLDSSDDTTRWCIRLGCSAEQLWHAVAAVGRDGCEVKAWLLRRRHGPRLLPLESTMVAGFS